MLKDLKPVCNKWKMRQGWTVFSIFVPKMEKTKKWILFLKWCLNERNSPENETASLIFLTFSILVQMHSVVNKISALLNVTSSVLKFLFVIKDLWSSSRLYGLLRRWILYSRHFMARIKIGEPESIVCWLFDVVTKFLRVSFVSTHQEVLDNRAIDPSALS